MSLERHYFSRSSSRDNLLYRRRRPYARFVDSKTPTFGFERPQEPTRRRLHHESEVSRADKRAEQARKLALEAATSKENAEAIENRMLDSIDNDMSDLEEMNVTANEQVEKARVWKNELGNETIDLSGIAEDLLTENPAQEAMDQGADEETVVRLTEERLNKFSAFRERMAELKRRAAGEDQEAA